LVKPPLVLLKRKLSPKQRQQPKQVLGERGEHYAVTFLQAKGFQILAVNVRLGVYEVDIVALDLTTNEVVFVEVKTRSGEVSGVESAVHAINYRKLRAMAKVAEVYLHDHNLANDYRFDMISVLPSRLDHFENVTWNRRR
jgi:putative endonuclease